MTYLVPYTEGYTLMLPQLSLLCPLKSDLWPPKTKKLYVML